MALALSRSVCARSLGFRLAAAANGTLPSAGVRCVSLKVIKAEPPSGLGHDEHNMAKGREMSPHLTIYAVQLTSMLSISHRFTGIILTGYAGALGLGALVLPNDFAAWVTVIEGLQLSAPALVAVKGTLAFPVTYHTFNGIRHLCWDNGLFLSLKEVYSTGWLMLACAAGSAAALAIL